MSKPKIKTTEKVVPMIYAYTTPEVKRHDGWTKIGYTEQDVDARIRQQTQTADIIYKFEWKGNAIYEDGSGDTFTDKDFHAYLEKNDIERQTYEYEKDGKKVSTLTKWFRVSPDMSKQKFYDFRTSRGILQ